MLKALNLSTNCVTKYAHPQFGKRGKKSNERGGGLKVKGFVLQVPIELFTSINIMKKSYYLAKN